MSRIFDALNRVRGEVADTILPLVEAPDGTASGAPAPPAPPEEKQPAGYSGSSLANVRSVPVRIAAPSALLPFDGSQWEASEQYRIVRTRIVQHPKRPRMIVISSAGAGDGKSVTATNVAGALGLKSDRVLLVDADFRRSSIHALLGLPQSPGLADVLAGHCTLEQGLVRLEQFTSLYVLTAGVPKANPVESLDHHRWPELCAELREMFDYIILDSPPMAVVADYDLIQAVCDGLIMVIRPDHTNRRLCLKTLRAVPDGKLIGVLLNCVARWCLGKYTSPNYSYYNGGEAYK